MEHLGKSFFSAGVVVTAWGVVENVASGSGVGGTGTMAMNSYYLLAIALFAASGAAQLIWGERK